MGMNQLPPVNQPAGPVDSTMGGVARPAIKASKEEKRFTQSLETLQAGRSQLEKQGFDMGRLTETAEVMSGLAPDLPFERGPAVPDARGGDQASDPAGEGIQQN